MAWLPAIRRALAGFAAGAAAAASPGVPGAQRGRRPGGAAVAGSGFAGDGVAGAGAAEAVGFVVAEARRSVGDVGWVSI